MEDEIEALLRQILATQKEHLAAYREFTAKALESQENYLCRLRRLFQAIVLLGAIGIVTLVGYGVLRVATW